MDKLRAGGEKYPSYIFPHSRDASYQTIEAEMLWYVVSTGGQNICEVAKLVLMETKEKWRIYFYK